MKIIILLSSIVLYVFPVSKDSRKVNFYFWNGKTSTAEILQKKFRQITDSGRIIYVDLIYEKNNHDMDTLSCSYVNNTISFDKIDTSQNKLLNMFLSIEIKCVKGELPFNERLTVPFLFLFKNTNTSSSLSFSFERERNNFYKVNISKLDYPFIVSSTSLTSEILGLNINGY